MDEHERQRAQQFDQQVDFNTNLIIEREDAIAEIERTMYGDSIVGVSHYSFAFVQVFSMHRREVNEIYGDLNALVIEQGERLGTSYSTI